MVKNETVKFFLTQSKKIKIIGFFNNVCFVSIKGRFWKSMELSWWLQFQIKNEIQNVSFFSSDLIIV